METKYENPFANPAQTRRNYSDHLKNPRWQKKRLEIFQRDNWQCQSCWSKDKTLNVHHIKYVGDFPWETPDKYLITLCEDCHKRDEDIKWVDLITLTRNAGYTRLEIFHIIALVLYRMERYRNKYSTRILAMNDEILAKLLDESERKEFLEFVGEIRLESDND